MVVVVGGGGGGVENRQSAGYRESVAHLKNVGSAGGLVSRFQKINPVEQYPLFV